ncbi:TIGR03915 family putative DNA repair protein [Rubricoccus marinus]|uniref:DUF4130 domain-containing protein n=1 Tax=Rubricoccus marinus TaxID=716817 RepID=A0A259TVM9_9BACT|nr:TIGR03915 family putative DNA repair protein [Rubricoccus marinus]OZC01793.1 hypothetical protein BSZ36_01595 [Rubricoccus marinus]
MPAPEARPSAPLQLGTATYATDGSFAGLLCAYARAHRAGALPAEVVTAGQAAPGHLFGAPEAVETEAPLASRMEHGLERVKPGLVGKLFRAFLSERAGIEVAILQMIDAVAVDGAEAVGDWTFEPSRQVSRWAQRVGREAHRMEAFVRFERHEEGASGEWAVAEKTPSTPLAPEAPVSAGPQSLGPSPAASGGERWLARVRPEYHVLPVIAEHFALRYPALRWTILDERRRLALVHDTPAADLAPEADATRIVPASSLPDLAPTADERAYQAMWRAYFRAVDIPERRNLKLHLRHVPKRYWPQLTEKQPEVSMMALTPEADVDAEAISRTAAPKPRRAVKALGPRSRT